jgi:protein-export SecD/SecF family membrane protein
MNIIQQYEAEQIAKLTAARAVTQGKVIAVVQPHRFTRLRDLFSDFCTCFNDADEVIVADVYTAGEAPIPGIDRDGLVEGLKRSGHRHALALESVADLPRIIARDAKSGDVVVLLGAGDITAWAYALPAQLDFLEQRVVGPSLGADSIKKGAMASLIGSLAVFLFVIFYYRVSGIIAVFSLILNVLFVLASLVGLEATLTLPGIAGIALTVGIAVDSNVVIYERIREEMRAGKRLHGAVEAGFQKAFRTILDANVTNALAAIVLLMYGTGPIKGFAVSLLIGIVTTVFTAVFVCKLIFDYYLARQEARGLETLSI